LATRSSTQGDAIALQIERIASYYINNLRL